MHRIITMVLGLLLIISAPGTAWAFSDTTSHWAETVIDHLAARDLVHGRGHNAFVPEAPVTRTEFAVMMINGLNLADQAVALQAGTCRFRDVAGNYWGRGYLELCRELGVMVPDARGYCYPQRPITRAEAAAMLVRALHLSAEGGQVFSDHDLIPAWARADVAAVAAYRIMNGFPDGTFKPHSDLTRAQAAVLIENILDFYGHKYQGYGILQNLDPKLGTARLIINGRSYYYDLADNFTLVPMMRGSPIDLPTACYFDLNSEGELVYCRATGEQGNTIELQTRKAVPGYALENLGDIFSLAVTDRQAQPLSAADPTQASSSSRTGDPRASSRQNLTEVGANDLHASGVDGSGITAAIIDTGIDPGHPDLQKTTDGRVKITHWVDLTDQGKVTLSPYPTADGRLILEDEEIDLGSYSSLSGQALMGMLDADRLPAELKHDAPELLVVALDNDRSGVYDMVLVDTDGDGQVSDERPLHLYNDSQEWQSLITADGAELNIVLSSLNAYNQVARIGFDASGHGTKVAGIAAGNGLVQGVAPGLSLAAFKIYEGNTADSCEKMKEAINLAAAMGIKLINISMGYAGLFASEREELEDLVNKLARDKGIIFCIAAGNLGPGLGSISVPASAEEAIGVGGYLSPSMWMLYYGRNVSQSTLYSFSSVGPTPTGGSSLLVAPATAVTTQARWSSDYVLEEGSSIAAPYVTGGAALLMQAAQKLDLNVSTEQIKSALLGAARPLPGYLPCEAGHGALDMAAAWELLLQGNSVPLKIASDSVGGFYSRQYLRTGSSFQVSNPSGSNRTLELSATESWIVPSMNEVQVPSRGGVRSLTLDYADLEQPGLYSGYLTGDDRNTPGVDLEVLQTLVVPHVLQDSNGYQAAVEGSAPAGQYRRYFFKVPPGSGALNIKVTVPQEGGRYLGCVRLFLYAPDGREVLSTPYAGAGYPEETASRYLEVKRDNPAPGVWETVVYSSAAIGRYQLAESRFRLEASLSDWTDAEPQAAEDKYIITCGCTELVPGAERNITLYVWDKITKKPVSNMILIDNKLYQVRQGMVRLKIMSTEIKPVLTLAW